MTAPFKLFEAEFDPVNPAGSTLIIAARTEKEARDLAETTLEKDGLVLAGLEEIEISECAQVIVYLSGDY